MSNKLKRGFKGKYCTGCNTVWEMPHDEGSVGKLIKHPDFPTYGLKRENCPECIRGPLEAGSNKLALERTKKLLQRIVDENQELFKKDDDKESK